MGAVDAYVRKRQRSRWGRDLALVGVSSLVTAFVLIGGVVAISLHLHAKRETAAIKIDTLIEETVADMWANAAPIIEGTDDPAARQILTEDVESAEARIRLTGQAAKARLGF